ncbi:MAG TPA: cupin domain-containing protein [Candidatus Binataceae bacterium]|nr:cupin domain-containing protein [Candidatus Binataceae bacterium]
MEPSKFLIKASDIKAREAQFSHPWNPKSLLIGTQISRMIGLKRTGVTIARIPQGKESFVYHSHHLEEEWLYILSGNGIAEIDGVEYEVGAGDFMAFPTPSVAHHLRNPNAEDLVYLMGGENLETEIADFPKMDKRMLRHGGTVEVYNLSDAKNNQFAGG